MIDRVPVKGNSFDSRPQLSGRSFIVITDCFLEIKKTGYFTQNYIMSFNFPCFIFRSSSSWTTPKFSQISCLTNTFLYIVSFNYSFSVKPCKRAFFRF